MANKEYKEEHTRVTTYNHFQNLIIDFNKNYNTDTYYVQGFHKNRKSHVFLVICGLLVILVFFFFFFFSFLFSILLFLSVRWGLGPRDFFSETN